MKRDAGLERSVPSLWRAAWRFRTWLQRERAMIAGAFAALLAGIGLRLLEPWPLKLVFDHVLTVDEAGGLQLGEWADRLGPTGLAMVAAAGVLAVGAMRAAADYWQSTGFSVAGNRALTQVRNELFARLHALSLSFHAQARGGDLMVRLIGDVNMLKDAISSAALPLLANILAWLGMVAFMFLMHWRLALMATLVTPLFWLVAAKWTRRIHAAAREQRQREGALASAAAESLHGIKSIQALSLSDRFVEEFARRSGKTLEEGLRTARLSARLERASDFAQSAATALVLGYGALLVRRHALSPGELLVFLTYVRRAFNPLSDFAKYSARLAKAAAAGERVIDILDRQPEIVDLPDAIPAPPLNGDITFEDVRFDYPTGGRVFSALSLHVPAGCMTAVVGPSGIGKSTLLHLLLRLFEPRAGRVLVDGRNIRDFTRSSLRGQMTVVLQDQTFFAGTVAENIAWGALGASREEIIAAARLASAHEFVEALPNGYDTALAERGVTLSHGQRQRLAIARAALRRAPILLLDEPVTGLDKEHERAVVDAIGRLARGRTALLVTHDLQLAAHADSIAYLHGGQVHEQGTHDELMRLGGKYAAVYALQASEAEVHAHERPALAFAR